MVVVHKWDDPSQGYTMPHNGNATQKKNIYNVIHRTGTRMGMEAR